jgi:hypothetical protein
MTRVQPAAWIAWCLLAASGTATSAGAQIRAITTQNLVPVRALPFTVDTLWAVGRPADAGRVEFGSVAGVAADDTGRIFVADVRLQTVHVLDAAGRPLRTIGRGGEGPGEFRLPMRVAVGPAGHLFVYDAFNGRVSQFDRTYQLVKTVLLATRLNVRTFLVTDTSIVVSGVDPSPRGSTSVIHEFSLTDGRLLRSFGDLHVVRSAELARRASAGPLVRTNDGSLWYASPGPYRIDQFRADGGLVLRVLRPNGFLEPAEDGVIVTSAGERLTLSHRARAVVSGLIVRGEGTLLHQVTLESGEVVTDEFRVAAVPGSGGEPGLRLLSSWVGGVPVLGPRLGADEYLIGTSDPDTGASGLARVRLRWVR